MLRYFLHRFLYMIATLLAVSVVTFVIMQLPPGDFMSSYIANLEAQGGVLDQAEIEALRHRYGLDQPSYAQYFKWLRGVLRGDFGVSFEWNKPVSELVWGRLGLTFLLSFSALIIHWMIAFPVGIYSAVHQYSLWDYLFTGLAFISASIPHFLLALILMWLVFKNFGLNIVGLFSSEFDVAPWSVAKVADMLKHIWAPLVILGLFGGASLIRVMRANLLDELHKPYVFTARAKGLTERKLLLRYPVRVALNPFVSTVGWALPGLISGTTITAIVLGLPTTGPLLLRALQSQDMYLAGSFLVLLSLLTIIGTFISDLLLAWLDPRIRFT